MSFLNFKKYLNGPKHVSKHMKRESYVTGLISLALFLFISATAAYAWTAPTGAPYDSNSAGPLNISGASQIKSGTVGVGGLLVNGNTSLQDKIQITGGDPGANKVLVSDAEGNARWMDYLLARKNSDRYRCPAGSSRISLNGKTFCGYWKTISGQCDAFGNSYDSLVACYDTGTGRNHGISPTDTGCYSWEGSHNNGGPGLKFYCEKLSYTPRDASECTAPGAIVGTLNDSSLSPNPITTCNVQTPYTYQGCATGAPGFGGCFKPGVWGRPTLTGLDTLYGTTTSCMAGWIKYLSDCI